MSKAMGRAPSEIVGLRDPDDPVAFWFDRAVLTFGRLVEKDIEDHVSRIKKARAIEQAATQRLMKWLDYDGTMTKQRFASPPIGKIIEQGGESNSRL